MSHLIAEATEPRVLRFFWIDQAGRIRHPAEEVECVDDAEARAKAAAMIEAQDKYLTIEIWDRARYVAKVSAQSSEDLGDLRCRSHVSQSAASHA